MTASFLLYVFGEREFYFWGGGLIIICKLDEVFE